MQSIKYLLCLLLLAACHNKKDQASLSFSTEPIDTVRANALSIYPKPSIFEKAFVKGNRDKIEKMDISFYGVNVGKLKVPTGRIAACDPFLTEEYGVPFTQVFPTGEFPVQLAIAHAVEGESIVFARIMFSEAPVNRWEYALLKGEKPAVIGAGEHRGFIVDAGIGAFMDESAAKILSTTDTILGDRRLYNELDKHRRPGWRSAIFSFGDKNLAAFSPAFGDGYYRSYIGFDAAGTPCRLLTDLGFKWDFDK